jgi:hypothetical protein
LFNGFGALERAQQQRGNESPKTPDGLARR